MGGGPRIGQALGRWAVRSAERPRSTLTIIGVLTLIVGAGMVQLETDSDLLKILPRGDPHTEAAMRASDEFRGFYDFVTFFYAIDEEKCTRVTAQQLPNRIPLQGPDGEEIGCDHVLHEAYIRGMDDVWDFLRSEIPQAEYSIDFAQLIKTVNWTNDGYFGDTPHESLLFPIINNEPDRIGRAPDDDAYTMPGTDPVGSVQFAGSFQGVLAADDAATDTVSPTLKAGRTLIFFDTSDGTSRVELGRAVYDAVDAYLAAVHACDAGEECVLTWNVFNGEEGVAVRGVSTLDAHASDVTQRDISRLAPFIVWAIILVLYVAFRDARVLLVSAANLLVAFVWTAGLMGWLQIPFSALNLTIIPLILGVGIDYGIHLISEYLEHKADGASDAESFSMAGRRAGVAMAIATVTTAVGLMLMAWSPSLLMAQLGIVSSIALVVTFAFTLTLVPAVLALTSTRPRHAEHGSRVFLKLATIVSRRRLITGVFVVLFSGMALVGVQALEPEPFGNPELNYPPGDRVRDDASTINEWFFGGNEDTQTNYLIVEGDLTDPAAHAFLDALEANLQEDPEIQAFNTASLTRIVRGWTAINQGTPKAIVHQFLLANTGNDDLRNIEYPQTREEMRALLDDLFASPFANFATILVNPGTYDMGMVAFDTRQDLDFASVQAVWGATERIIQETKAETGYDGLAVHQFGNNAFSYLFITKEQPWVNTIGVVAFVLVVAMIAVLTRSIRATACTAAIMGATSLWWLGALPSMGVGLSVGLMLPMVFIMAIGSDDAIHLIWSIERTGDPKRVYRFVGKAVTLTTVTTLVAFLIFSFQTDLLVRKTLLSTAVAIAMMWVATVLVVPLFYPVPEESPAPPAARRPARPQAHVAHGKAAKYPEQPKELGAGTIASPR